METHPRHVVSGAGWQPAADFQSACGRAPQYPLRQNTSIARPQVRQVANLRAIVNRALARTTADARPAERRNQRRQPVRCRAGLHPAADLQSASSGIRQIRDPQPLRRGAGWQPAADFQSACGRAPQYPLRPNNLHRSSPSGAGCQPARDCQSRPRPHHRQRPPGGTPQPPPTRE